MQTMAGTLTVQRENRVQLQRSAPEAAASALPGLRRRAERTSSTSQAARK